MSEAAKGKLLAETARGHTEDPVGRMAASCLTTAQAMADSTGAPVQVWLSGGPREGTGFRLRAGTWCTLVARLSDKGWDVVTRSRSGTLGFSYPTDQEFENAHESLLQPVITSALEAWVARWGAPPPPAASSERRVKVSLSSKLRAVLAAAVRRPRSPARWATMSAPSERASLQAENRRLADAQAAFAVEHERLAEAQQALRADAERLAQAQQGLNAEAERAAKTRDELTAEAARLAPAREYLETERARLAEAREHLKAEQARLADTQTRLDATKAALTRDRRALEAEEARVAAARLELEAARAQVREAGTAQAGVSAPEQRLFEPRPSERRLCEAGTPGAAAAVAGGTTYKMLVRRIGAMVAAVKRPKSPARGTAMPAPSLARTPPSEPRWTANPAAPHAPKEVDPLILERLRSIQERSRKAGKSQI